MDNHFKENMIWHQWQQRGPVVDTAKQKQAKNSNGGGKNKNGLNETLLIEIKPKKQCSPPEKKKRITKSYLCDLKNWGVNSAKWEAAQDFAENRGWKFKVLTEDTLLR